MEHERGLQRYRTRLLAVRPGAVRRQDAGLRDGVSGRQAATSTSRAKVRQGRQFRVPVVFDNLIHKKQMPVTVGIFINPGTFPSTNPKAGSRSNRSFEYDTLSDQYGKFLEKEILPEVEKTLKLRNDAAGRAICGISSGGNSAFTAAWERPDMFSKDPLACREFHKHSRRPCVPRADPQDGEEADSACSLQDGTGDLDNLHVGAGSGEPANGFLAAVDGVRLQACLRRRWA